MSLRVIIGVLEGLAYTHDLAAYDGAPLRLVHRDISPQNVFVTYGGQVKLLDFGIAKAASSRTETATGVLKGKLRYMAPEQIQFDAVDRRTDIYAAGCMLWALAAGQPLWSGVSDVDILRGVLAGEVPSLRRANPNCDEELERIVKKSMAHRPEDRYQTALELQADLEQFSERLGKPVKQKALAKLVGEVFAMQRAELLAVIEKQLSLQAAEATVPMLQLVEETGPSDHRSTEVVSPPLTERPPRRWLPTLGAVALVVFGSAAGALVMPGWLRGNLPQRQSSFSPSVQPPTPIATSSPSVQPPTPIATSPRPPSPDAEQREAMVSFRIVPPEAALTLDGVSLPSGSKSRVLPVDDARHVLAAEAAAYHPSRLEFTVSADMTVELVLPKAASRKRARSVPRPSPSRPAPSAAETVAASTAPDAPPAPDCQNPLFMDARGIKHMRPECR